MTMTMIIIIIIIKLSYIFNKVIQGTKDRITIFKICCSCIQTKYLE